MGVSQVIAAEGEHRASRSLKEAAQVINESPAALQVSFELRARKLFKNNTTAASQNYLVLNRVEQAFCL